MNNIKIDAYVLCWNEEKLAPFLLDYYSNFVSNLYILDNGSTDNTLNILKAEKRFNVEIIPYESGNKLDDSKYLELKNNIWKRSKGKADFVVVCDFDEFLYANDILDKFQYMKDNGMTICQPYIYDLYSLKFPVYNKYKLLHEIVQFGMDNQGLGKQILFNPNEIQEINYAPGAHYCEPIGNIKYYDKKDIYLFHGKYLSVEYVVEKHKKYKERLSNINKEKGWGIHYSNEIEKQTKYIIENYYKCDNICKKISTQKRVVIDGGARIGEAFDILINKRRDLDDATILLYECNPKHIQTLEKITETDKRDIRVFQNALWNKNEFRSFYFSEDQWGDLGCTLKSEKKEKLDREHPINVMCVDINDIIDYINKDKYIILKLDIEGAEYEVLERLIETGNIERINELYVEFYDSFFNKDSTELKEKLKKYSIECHFDWV